MQQGDRKHRDWLLDSVIKQIQTVDPAITSRIIPLNNDRRILVLDNITSESLGKLFFYTNTDQNNNFLYVESLTVSISRNVTDTPIKVPGLTILAKELWAQSDSNSFFNGEKIHTPFNNKAMTNPFTGKDMDIPTWVDIYTAALKFLPKTAKENKIFKLILNPDLTAAPPDLNSSAPANPPSTTSQLTSSTSIASDISFALGFLA